MWRSSSFRFRLRRTRYTRIVKTTTQIKTIKNSNLNLKWLASTLFLYKLLNLNNSTDNGWKLSLCWHRRLEVVRLWRHTRPMKHLTKTFFFLSRSFAGPGIRIRRTRRLKIGGIAISVSVSGEEEEPGEDGERRHRQHSAAVPHRQERGGGTRSWTLHVKRITGKLKILNLFYFCYS